MSRVALYIRVSTATRRRKTSFPRPGVGRTRGHEVVEVYTDHGFSGTKGRDKRPAFDAMLKDCVRRHFDILAVWSSDRLGRSMKHRSRSSRPSSRRASTSTSTSKAWTRRP